MIVDGKSIAEQMYEKIRTRIENLGRTPVFTIITCEPNIETKKYLALKKKKTAQIGIRTEVIELGFDSTTEDVIASIESATPHSDCILVQFPLPAHIDRDAVVQHIPLTHDADVLNPENNSLLSPVVGAIVEILRVYEVDISKRHVVILGSGKLVGLPAFKWFTEHGSAVSIVTKDTENISYYTKHADIIVCGAGVPNVVTADMVKDGVVILDAGTTEDSGVLKGDASPDIEEKALLFTPVPGGIGPITIAVLLQNIVVLAEERLSI